MSGVHTVSRTERGKLTKRLMLYIDTQTVVAARSGTKIRGSAESEAETLQSSLTFLNICVPLPTRDAIKSV